MKVTGKIGPLSSLAAHLNPALVSAVDIIQRLGFPPSKTKLVWGKNPSHIPPLSSLMFLFPPREVATGGHVDAPSFGGKKSEEGSNIESTKRVGGDQCSVFFSLARAYSGQWFYARLCQGESPFHAWPCRCCRDIKR